MSSISSKPSPSASSEAPHESAALQALRGRYPDVTASVFHGQIRWTTPPSRLIDVLRTLCDQGGFDYLVDLTCVDYLTYRDADHRFGLVYIVDNTATNERLIVRTFLDDPEPSIPSVVSLWEGANWLEREVWDMFGIQFEGHPDLRRILMPEPFSAHPLRKDYPLQGRGERHNFTAIRRGDA